MSTKAYAAQAAESPLAPFSLTRRDPLPNDVLIDILYCGVCHSDLHQARNEWGNTIYPCVPGHEILGRVAKVGSAVSRFKEGDLAAVGCMVDSCRKCPACLGGLEQYCETGGTVFTYNGPDKILGGVTFGGYSENIVVDEAFVLKVSDKVKQADLAGTAPCSAPGSRRTRR
ncbi:Aldehyde reductase YahK [Planctomyces sp. SH-PL62]|nr:alcohol dehydrogenase catalytic domain-containing protein [Planctomyces sp. SH-PL62]AMV36489.1 Aldehyde reductase YahK [Planctomyces sp. SH-PL62]